MNWLEKTASPEKWLSSKGVPQQFIEYAVNDRFPTKMQKWVAIQLYKINKSQEEPISPEELIKQHKDALIEARDWYKYQSRNVAKFDINRFNLIDDDPNKSVAHQVELWQESMANERGEGHAREYRYPRGPNGLEFEELGNGFTMVQVHPDDLANEGAIMQHCVGDEAQDYAQKVHNGQSIIYSLRDAKGWPHATIEVEDENFMSEEDWEEYANDPENQIYDDLGNLVEIDYENWGIDRGGGKPSWTIAQIQGKQNDPPVNKYRPYLKSWIQQHPEFHASDHDMLSITSDEDLLSMMESDKSDRTFDRLFTYLSDEAKAETLEQVVEDKGFGWSNAAISKAVNKVTDMYPFGVADQDRKNVLLQFLGEDYADVVRAGAMKKLSIDLIRPVNRDPKTREWVKKLAIEEQSSPDVAKEALNLLSRTIENPLDKGKKGPLKTSFDPDILPIALEVSQRFAKFPTAYELHNDILNHSLRVVDADTASLLVRRALDLPHTSTYQVRMNLGNVPTQHFYEIWKRLGYDTQAYLLKEDAEVYSTTTVYQEMNRHQFALERWSDYLLALDKYNKEKREREEDAQRRIRVDYANDLVEPSAPEWDENWIRDNTASSKNWLIRAA